MRHPQQPATRSTVCKVLLAGSVTERVLVGLKVPTTTTLDRTGLRTPHLVAQVAQVTPLGVSPDPMAACSGEEAQYVYNNIVQVRTNNRGEGPPPEA